MNISSRIKEASIKMHIENWKLKGMGLQNDTILVADSEDKSAK